ncbi:MAG: TRAP transporter small permease [Deltaproteobacteria bacterium]|nr:TRAP transporter small permease [Deltaproteobacteria bacterium]
MRKRKAQSLQQKITRLNDLCASLAGLILLFVTISIFVDVILRYFFNRPSIWVTEITTYLFLYIIFLGTAYALQQGMHIRVTFLVDLLGQRAGRAVNVFTSMLAMIFTMVLLWQASVMTWTAFKENWTSPTMLSAPYGYIYLAMVLGCLLLFLTFFFETITLFQRKDQGGP